MAEKFVMSAETAAKDLEESRKAFKTSIEEILIGLKAKGNLTPAEKELLTRTTNILNEQLRQVADYTKDLGKKQVEVKDLGAKLKFR